MTGPGSVEAPRKGANTCYNFLYQGSFSRAHLRRAGPDGLDVACEDRARPNGGRDERPGWAAAGGRGQIGGKRRWRCGSFRRALRAEALRRAELPRPVVPVTGRVRYPPYLPGAAPASRSQAVSLAPDAPIAGKRSRSTGRNAAHCPGRLLHPQGHPKILSNRSAERIFRTHPCARSLCRPSGPDGKGQAKGQARKRARRTSIGRLSSH